MELQNKSATLLDPALKSKAKLECLKELLCVSPELFNQQSLDHIYTYLVEPPSNNCSRLKSFISGVTSVYIKALLVLKTKGKTLESHVSLKLAELLNSLIEQITKPLYQVLQADTLEKLQAIKDLFVLLGGSSFDDDSCFPKIVSWAFKLEEIYRGFKFDYTQFQKFVKIHEDFRLWFSGWWKPKSGYVETLPLNPKKLSIVKQLSILVDEDDSFLSNNLVSTKYLVRRMLKVHNLKPALINAEKVARTEEECSFLKSELRSVSFKLSSNIIQKSLISDTIGANPFNNQSLRKKLNFTFNDIKTIGEMWIKQHPSVCILWEPKVEGISKKQLVDRISKKLEYFYKREEIKLVILPLRISEDNWVVVAFYQTNILVKACVELQDQTVSSAVTYLNLLFDKGLGFESFFVHPKYEQKLETIQRNGIHLLSNIQQIIETFINYEDDFLARFKELRFKTEDPQYVENLVTQTFREVLALKRFVEKQRKERLEQHSKEIDDVVAVLEKHGVKKNKSEIEVFLRYSDHSEAFNYSYGFKMVAQSQFQAKILRTLEDENEAFYSQERDFSNENTNGLGSFIISSNKILKKDTRIQICNPRLEYKQALEQYEQLKMRQTRLKIQSDVADSSLSKMRKEKPNHTLQQSVLVLASKSDLESCVTQELLDIIVRTAIISGNAELIQASFLISESWHRYSDQSLFPFAFAYKILTCCSLSKIFSVSDCSYKVISGIWRAFNIRETRERLKEIKKKEKLCVQKLLELKAQKSAELEGYLQFQERQESAEIQHSLILKEMFQAKRLVSYHESIHKILHQNIKQNRIETVRQISSRLLVEELESRKIDCQRAGRSAWLNNQCKGMLVSKLLEECQKSNSLYEDLPYDCMILLADYLNKDPKSMDVLLDALSKSSQYLPLEAKDKIFTFLEQKQQLDSHTFTLLERIRLSPHDSQKWSSKIQNIILRGLEDSDSLEVYAFLRSLNNSGIPISKVVIQELRNIRTDDAERLYREIMNEETSLQTISNPRRGLGKRREAIQNLKQRGLCRNQKLVAGLKTLMQEDESLASELFQLLIEIAPWSLNVNELKRLPLQVLRFLLGNQANVSEIAGTLLVRSGPQNATALQQALKLNPQILADHMAYLLRLMRTSPSRRQQLRPILITLKLEQLEKITSVQRQEFTSLFELSFSQNFSSRLLLEELHKGYQCGEEHGALLFNRLSNPQSSEQQLNSVCEIVLHFVRKGFFYQGKSDNQSIFNLKSLETATLSNPRLFKVPGWIGLIELLTRGPGLWNREVEEKILFNLVEKAKQFQQTKYLSDDSKRDDQKTSATTTQQQQNTSIEKIKLKFKNNLSQIYRFAKKGLKKQNEDVIVQGLPKVEQVQTKYYQMLSLKELQIMKNLLSRHDLPKGLIDRLTMNLDQQVTLIVDPEASKNQIHEGKNMDESDAKERYPGQQEMIVKDAQNQRLKVKYESKLIMEQLLAILMSQKNSNPVILQKAKELAVRQDLPQQVRLNILYLLSDYCQQLDLAWYKKYLEVYLNFYGLTWNHSQFFNQYFADQRNKQELHQTLRIIGSLPLVSGIAEETFKNHEPQKLCKEFLVQNILIKTNETYSDLELEEFSHGINGIIEQIERETVTDSRVKYLLELESVLKGLAKNLPPDTPLRAINDILTMCDNGRYRHLRLEAGGDSLRTLRLAWLEQKLGESRIQNLSNYRCLLTLTTGALEVLIRFAKKQNLKEDGLAELLDILEETEINSQVLIKILLQISEPSANREAAVTLLQNQVLQWSRKSILSGQTKHVITPDLYQRLMSLYKNGWKLGSIVKLLNAIPSSRNSRDLETYLKQVITILSQYGVSSFAVDQQEENLFSIITKHQPKESLVRINRLAFRQIFQGSFTKNVEDLISQIIALNKPNLPTYLQDHRKILHDFLEFKRSAEKIREFTKEDIQQIFKQNSNPPKTSQLQTLAFACRAIELHSDFYPRDVQVLTCLIVLNSSQGKGRLVQVNTGEGKTTIVAILALLKCIEGKTVDIITSSPELAKPQAQEMTGFYEIFGLTVSYLDSNITNSQKKERYKKDIIYGSAGQFQGDILRDEFSHKETRNGRRFEVAIVDQVDSMLVDGKNHIVMLADKMPAMDHLEHLLALIWQFIEQVVMTLYQQQGNTYVLPVEFLELRQQTDEEFRLVSQGQRAFLVPQSSCTALNDVAIDQLQEKQICELGVIEIDKIEDKTHYIVESTEAYMKRILSKQPAKEGSEKTPEVVYPAHLEQYVLRGQLKQWIENALVAKYGLQENEEYIIKNNKILPVDATNTGVVQTNTNWSNGIHQFLQLKHGVPITPQSLTTNYISNIAFFKRYKENLFGLTGTLGTQQTRDLLAETYSVDCMTIPPFRKKQHFELPAILCPNENNWYEQIVSQISLNIRVGRAVLVITQFIKQVDQISSLLLKAGLQSYRIKCYRTENDAYVIKDKLAPGDVVLATNIAGRGTDLRMEDEVQTNGGLHVCITFLPINQRVSEQNQGRTSRKGNQGTSQFILNEEKLKESYSPTDYEDLLRQRKLMEDKETKESKETIIRVTKKDEVFKRFCGMLQRVQKNKKKTIQERFGIWLRVHAEQIQKSPEPELLSFFERSFVSPIQNQQDCILNPYYHVLNGVKELQKQNYEDAIKEYEKAIQKDKSDLVAEAYYGRGYALVACFGEKRERQKLIEAKNDFESAKRIILQKIYGIITIIEASAKGKKELGVQMGRRYEIYDLMLTSINEAVGQGEEARIQNQKRQIQKRLQQLIQENKQISPEVNDEEEVKKLKHKTIKENHLMQTKLKQNLSNIEKQIEYIKKDEEAREQQERKIMGVIQYALQKNQEVIIKMTPIEEALTGRQLTDYEDELSERNSNGFFGAFTISVQRPVPWAILISLGALAVGQIALGASLTVFSMGLAGQVGMALIAEGISDMFCLIQGYKTRSFSWKQWAVQKAISYTVSLITAGWGAVKQAGRMIGRGAKRAYDIVKYGYKSVSKSLLGFTKEGWKLAAKLVGKQVGKRVVSEVGSKLTQLGVNELVIPKIQQMIQQHFDKKIEELFNKNQMVQELMQEDLQQGDEKWQKEILGAVEEFINPPKKKDGFWRTVTETIDRTTKSCGAIGQYSKGVTKCLSDQMKIAGALNVQDIMMIKDVLTSYIDNKHLWSTIQTDLNIKIKQVHRKYRQEKQQYQNDSKVVLIEKNQSAQTRVSGSNKQSQLSSTNIQKTGVIKKRIAEKISQKITLSINQIIVTPLAKKGAQWLSNLVGQSIFDMKATMEQIDKYQNKRRQVARSEDPDRLKEYDEHQKAMQEKRIKEAENPDEKRKQLDEQKQSQAEKIIQDLENDGEAGLHHLSVIADKEKRPIQVIKDGKLLTVIGRKYEGEPICITHTKPQIPGSSGHWSIPGRKDQPLSSGLNNCLFDAIGAQTGVSGDEMRRRCIEDMRNNFDSVLRQATDVAQYKHYMGGIRIDNIVFDKNGVAYLKVFRGFRIEKKKCKNMKMLAEQIEKRIALNKSEGRSKKHPMQHIADSQGFQSSAISTSTNQNVSLFFSQGQNYGNGEWQSFSVQLHIPIPVPQGMTQQQFTKQLKSYGPKDQIQLKMKGVIDWTDPSVGNKQVDDYSKNPNKNLNKKTNKKITYLQSRQFVKRAGRAPESEQQRIYNPYQYEITFQEDIDPSYIKNVKSVQPQPSIYKKYEPQNLKTKCISKDIMPFINKQKTDPKGSQGQPTLNYLSIPDNKKLNLVINPNYNQPTIKPDPKSKGNPKTSSLTKHETSDESQDQV